MSLRAGESSSQHELLDCQIEMATPVCSSAQQALDSIQGFRQGLARTASGHGLIAVSLGTAPLIGASAAGIAPTERYREIHRYLPGISSEQYVSGLHVHVSIKNSESGVHARNGIRRWLPALAAMGANSPFWRGQDSGFASWRSIHYRQWSVQGIQPYFTDADDYYKRLAKILGSDVVLDAGHIGWAARLSNHYPTMEIRISDAQLQANKSVALALIIRALVETIIREPDTQVGLNPELLDLAFWQAAKHGLEGNQLDPETGDSIRSDQLVRVLLSHIRGALDENGDVEFVKAATDRLLTRGNGAWRQRESMARGGISRVISDAANAFTA